MGNYEITDWEIRKLKEFGDLLGKAQVLDPSNSHIFAMRREMDLMRERFERAMAPKPQKTLKHRLETIVAELEDILEKPRT